ncbi:glycoside hydrolase family 57 [Oceanibacterium hippocampi]|uniref:Glycosyl hydrolase family 57 n=1 Tax=Oceanibacterium hippocampi TaxID=745714 RepID=A0A1Y5SHS6_9PROT|nr:glycoside hydrolase family 57 [Oceanibacterium hippocampi]SLN38136.1 Glycosyl hydrolase family 57 [Oceanibacterium hippocampi]
MAGLRGYALFHLNLAFSAVEEEARGEIIRRCYWPLLDLARRDDLKISIEATGFTLEEIARRDPGWLEALRAGIAAGRIEVVGSGYAQLIGPLVPADVNRANLRLGHAVYQRLLGCRPDIALVNEQAYSAGLVPLYRAAGYRALVMDWDGVAAAHPDWPAAMRYYPQAAIGADGASMPLIFSNTIAFQKLQRLAHGDLGPDDWLDYLARQQGDAERGFPLYGNDAEIFDFRPGRFETEGVPDETSEWARLRAAFRAFRAVPGYSLVHLHEMLTLEHPEHGNRAIRLESPACPIPVKKQTKYNVTRWAVTGRDDSAINGRCHALAERLRVSGNAGDDAWRELCLLWSSDFRTHITERRWSAYGERLRALEARLGVSAPDLPAPALAPINGARPTANGDILEIETDAVRIRLNTRRGLAIDGLWLGDKQGEPLCGTLPHGYFDDIGYGYDWYSGTLVLESPARAKVTDLTRVSPEFARVAGNDDIVIDARMATPLGIIEKRLIIGASAAVVNSFYTLHWREWPLGSLRIGNITLNPAAFEEETLAVTTHNGGETAERFALAGQEVDHGAAVSMLVSATSGFGMTEGRVEIGDGRHSLGLSVSRANAAPIGLLTHKRIKDRLFCRLSLSTMELDETRRPADQVPEQSNGGYRFHYALHA